MRTARGYRVRRSLGRMSSRNLSRGVALLCVTSAEDAGSLPIRQGQQYMVTYGHIWSLRSCYAPMRHLTPKEVAVLAGCCTEVVRRAIKAGRLETARRGRTGHWYAVPEPAALAWVLSRRPTYNPAQGKRAKGAELDGE